MYSQNIDRVAIMIVFTLLRSAHRSRMVRRARLRARSQDTSKGQASRHEVAPWRDDHTGFDDPGAGTDTRRPSELKRICLCHCCRVRAT